jgi:hypothetical protein
VIGDTAGEKKSVARRSTGLDYSSSAVEHQIEIWCSQGVGLLCSVNDAVNVLPCSTWAYLNGGPLLTCAALPG